MELEWKVKDVLGKSRLFSNTQRSLTKSTSFGNRLAQARLNLGAKQGRFISQAELGEMAGLTGASVGNYEAGRTEPSYLIVARLAKVLGVTAGFLAFGENGRTLSVEEGTEVPVERPTKRSRRKKA